MRFAIASIILAISSSAAAAAVFERQTGGIITCTCLSDLTLRAAQAESQTSPTYTCYYGSKSKKTPDFCTYNQVMLSLFSFCSISDVRLQILGNLVATNMKHCNTEVLLPCV
jgi:hypothetical protein